MLKMQSKFFTYITPVLELARQNEHQAAAEVMQHVANTIIQSNFCFCLRCRMICACQALGTGYTGTSL